MEIELITVYAYHGDGGERGTGPVIGWCSTEDKAQIAGRHTGYYDSQGGVSTANAIKIGNDFYLLARKKPIDVDGINGKHDDILRDKTMASLTSEQKRVLGL